MVDAPQPDQLSGQSSQIKAYIRDDGIRPPHELFVRNRAAIMRSVLSPVLMIGASLAVIGWGGWPWYAALPVHFLFLLGAQRSFQTLVHDGSHKLFSESRSTNDLLANLLAAGWIGSTVGAYRTVHLKHHRYNGSDQDPEHIDFAMLERRGGMLVYLLRYALGFESLRLIRKYYFPQQATSAARPRDARSETPADVSPQAAAGWRRLLFSKWHILVCQLTLLGAFAFAAGGMPYWYLLWLYLAISWSPAISALRFLVEHPGDSDLTVSTISWVIERSYFAPNNFNYHLEHHLWPSLPPYRLRAAHRYLNRLGFFERHPECANSTFVGSLILRGTRRRR